MEPGNLYIGTSFPHGHERPFGLTRADRRHHLYVIGNTGTGKTTMLRNAILQDILAGEGVGLLDPHGDLAEDLLDHTPPWRADDLVYFDPADREHPVALNLFARVGAGHRDLVASGVVSAFKGVWRESWGPRLEYILYAAVAALLECQNVSLLGLPRMLVDRRYRQWVVRQVRDPVVRGFWIGEFERYDARFRQEAIAPIQNKVGQLLMSPPVRNVLGQVKSKIDPGFVMDDGRLFIANLSKGRLGEDKSRLLGSLLVTQFQLAALARAGVPEAERRDFWLYLDEFQNFGESAFASILSESRKYRLGLTAAHQYLGQVPEALREAVLGNVGTMIAFRVGERDAEVLARYFGSYPPGHFSGLDNHEVCVKTIEGGRQREAFTGKTLPPIAARRGRREWLLQRSREKYAAPRATVEAKIERWMRPR